MELKKYQTKVIDDFKKYLAYLSVATSPREAYDKYWLSRSVANPDPYTERVPGCPYVSLKVPTAWGKTYLAVHALAEILEDSIPNEPRVVLWIVPWDTILTQTIASLRDKDHPYRRRLDTQFSGKVEIYDKQSVLMGAGFTPASIRDQVSIIVLSMASFRRQNKEWLKSFQENGQLAGFADQYKDAGKRIGMIEWVDDTALAQVFNRLHPVMIIDESHRAEAPLSVETLVHLNPRFILGLTATPKRDANIVSFVNALDLKKEEMVKLPVIAKHVQTKDEVITQSVHLRNTLEVQAKLLEVKGGRYIRPIVLFQAESKNKTDVIDYDKIKDNLISWGIPEEQIAIKVAARDDLSGVDLLSRDCPVRYIITVNALKEWWDCPFACILASIANRTSVTDVTQIIGRILRQPYAKRVEVSALNLSYVFSSSIDFAKTVDSIITWLIEWGFEQSDVVTMDTIGDREIVDPIIAELGHAEQIVLSEESDIEDFTLTLTESLGGVSVSETPETHEMMVEAEKQDIGLMRQAERNTGVDVPLEYQDRTAGYALRSDIRDLVESIALPEFYLDAKMGLFWDRFKLGMGGLLDGFSLANSDSHITFDTIDEEIFTIDVDTENHVRYRHTSPELQQYILSYIDSLPQAEQIEYVVRIVCNEIGKRTEVDAKDIFSYVNRILSWASATQIGQIKKSPLGLASQIRNKIESLEEAYMKKRFFELVDSGKLITEGAWKFPTKIFPLELSPSLSGSLFEREGSMSEFERKMIEKISSLENITFWHRNESRKWFSLNGWKNHYPDFIIMTASWRIILIETKWGHLDGKDSEEKIALGKAWAGLGWSKYRYFMVFSEENIIPGSYSVNQVCDIIRGL